MGKPVNWDTLCEPDTYQEHGDWTFQTKDLTLLVEQGRAQAKD
jgi:hypothetical protein